MKKESGFTSLKQGKLQDRVRESILREIKNGAFPEGKLPTEGKLAEMLGVSRATISITLAYMEREGIVVRRHGAATYVNQGYKDIHSLINQGVGVYELIRQNGYTPGLLEDSITEMVAENLDSAIVDKLHLERTDKIYRVQRVFGAEGRPAVLTQEYMPGKFLVKPLDIADFPKTIYALSEQYCTSPIEFTLVEIIPCQVDEFLAEKLECQKNGPILLTEEIHLNNHSVPMIYSKVFTLDKYIRFQAIRIRQ